MTLRVFLADSGGNLAVMLAVVAVPVMGAVGVALDHGRQTSAHTDLRAIAQEACLRVNSSFHEARSVAERRSAANAVISRRLADLDQDLHLDDISSDVSIIGNRVKVRVAATIPPGLSSVAGITDLNLNVEMTCADPKANEILVFADGFEEPQVTDTRGWHIFPKGPVWKTIEGAGPEYKTDWDPLTPALRPAEGRQFVELDSDLDVRRGALPTTISNSAIRAHFWAGPGEYRLVFSYRMRSALPLSSPVAAYYSTNMGRPFENEIIRADGGLEWSDCEALFTITKNGNHFLTFRAEGLEDLQGGLIDNVRVYRVN